MYTFMILQYRGCIKNKWLSQYNFASLIKDRDQRDCMDIKNQWRFYKKFLLQK